MSAEDLLGKLNDHVKATAQLHTALHEHLKADPKKVAECDRLIKAHATTTNVFHDDAAVLVRPTQTPTHH